MKKVCLLLLCAALVWSMTSCGGSTPQPEPPTPAAPADPAETPEELPPEQAPTALVVYFSRVGNTDFPADVDAVTGASLNLADGELKGNAQLMAEWMADEAGADLAEIRTEYTYPADYTAATEAARQEQNNLARPVLRGPQVNLSRYDTVYLVVPVWWGDLPMAVYSFFDAWDCAGKTIYVSVTHEGSGFSRTVNAVRALEPEAEVREGLALPGGSVAASESVARQFVRDNR